MGSANERHCYNITSLIGWGHTQMTKRLGSPLIRHRYNSSALARYLINIDPRVFAIWEPRMIPEIVFILKLDLLWPSVCSLPEEASLCWKLSLNMERLRASRPALTLIILRTPWRLPVKPPPQQPLAMTGPCPRQKLSLLMPQQQNPSVPQSDGCLLASQNILRAKRAPWWRLLAVCPPPLLTPPRRGMYPLWGNPYDGSPL